jgi:hypothetical protein
MVCQELFTNAKPREMSGASSSEVLEFLRVVPIIGRK